MISFPRRLLLPLLVSLSMLAGCASDKVFEDTAKAEYEHAKQLVHEGDYGRAAMDLEHFSSRHPYSRFTVKAELLRIFAAYKDGQFVLSETLSERFIERHPRHPNVDYAKYMLAMSHYRERSDAERDPTQTKLAIESFKTLLKDHPDSVYAKDGRRYLQRLYNELAEHELTVGKFYFDNDRFVAAANRFQVVLKQYQTTPAIEEALYYLAASYAELGLKDNARQTAMLLRHNYPRSPWSEKAAEFR